MTTSTSRILPFVFLPFLIASCSNDVSPIDFGHDNCSVCEKPIDDPAIAAQAVNTEGVQFNYDSIECLVHHLGQEEDKMTVIKVADYQHPGFMLNAQQSHYRIDEKSENHSHLAALRHNRANTICWKELQARLLQAPGYISQNLSEEETINKRG